jgi:MFS family permease
MTSHNFYGWKLLAALWIVVLINLAFPFYGSRVLDTVMISDLDLNRQALGGIFSLFTIMSGIPGPLVAVCVNRLGVRFTMISGSLLVAAGSVLMATVVSSGLVAALAFGIVVGFGVAMGGIISAQAGLVRWFVYKRAFTLAILSSATAVGGFVAAPLLNQVIEFGGGDWRMGWWFIAVLSCAAAAISALFVKEWPADLGQQPDGMAEDTTSSIKKQDTATIRSAVHRTGETWTYRESLSGPVYWLLMFCQMGVSCGYVVFIAHGLVHLMDLGHTREAGSWAIGLLAIVGLLGKGIVAAFGDRIDPRYILAIFSGLFGVGQILVVQADTTALLVAFALCMGIGFGGAVVCLAAVLSNYFGTKPFASLIGLAIAVTTTIGAVASFLAGRLYDSGYGYQGIFYTGAIWCIAGAVIMFMIKPPFKNKNSA